MALSAVAPTCAPIEPPYTAAELAETLRNEQLSLRPDPERVAPAGWRWILDQTTDCPDLTPAAYVALDAARRQLQALQAAHHAMHAAGLALVQELEAKADPG